MHTQKHGGEGMFISSNAGSAHKVASQSAPAYGMIVHTDVYDASGELVSAADEESGNGRESRQAPAWSGMACVSRCAFQT